MMSRLSVPARNRVILLGSALALAVLAGLVVTATLSAPASAPATEAASSAPAPTGPPRTLAELAASPGKLDGVFAPNLPASDEEYRDYVETAGARPNVIAMFDKWDQPFRADRAAKAYERGAIPLISWESWEKGGAKDDATYAPARIAAGDFDTYLHQYAQDIADFGRVVMIRFDHEMNGNWYPWGSGVNGTTPADYVAAWRHVHDIFTQEGAGNVAWIWAPNITRYLSDSLNQLTALYPGDDYVDYVGMSGYASKLNPDAAAMYGPTFDMVRTFTQRPFILTEIGALPSESKAAYITTLFAMVRARPDVVGLVWFQTTKASGATGDYEIGTDPSDVAAYRAGVASLPRIIPGDGYGDSAPPVTRPEE